MINLKKYKQFKLGIIESFRLKFLEYFRNYFRSKKFNNTTGKSIQFVNFINYTSGFDIEISKSHFAFNTNINNSTVKFYLRKKSSDIFVFNQVVCEKEYSFLLNVFENKGKEYVFLDIGSNIGLSTLFFKAHYASAKIFCLEPEVSNFDALNTHVRINKLENVVTINKGLYVTDGFLYPSRSFRDGEHWSFKLSEVPEGNELDKIETVSIRSLINEFGLSLIDFMKVDIEGGEAPLLRDPEFLDVISRYVKVIAFEIHPEVITYEEAQKNIKESGFFVLNMGGTYIGLNKKLYLHTLDV